MCFSNPIKISNTIMHYIANTRIHFYTNFTGHIFTVNISPDEHLLVWTTRSNRKLPAVSTRTGCPWKSCAMVLRRIERLMYILSDEVLRAELVPLPRLPYPAIPCHTLPWPSCPRRVLMAPVLLVTTTRSTMERPLGCTLTKNQVQDQDQVQLQEQVQGLGYWSLPQGWLPPKMIIFLNSLI